MKDPLFDLWEKAKQLRIKTVKVTVPEIVAYFSDDPDSELIPDWQCSNCGYGVADDYVACPHCGSWLDWSRAEKPSKQFLEFLKEL